MLPILVRSDLFKVAVSMLGTVRKMITATHTYAHTLFCPGEWNGTQLEINATVHLGQVVKLVA